jgi:predicted peptidase
MRNVSLVFGSIVLGLAALAQAVAADPSPQQPRQLDRTIKVTMKYLLYLPKDYEQKESWPLLLFLHGSGGVGDDLNIVRKIGVAKVIEEGKQFPFIVVSPQWPKGYWWEPFALTALLDEIVEKYKVDHDRIYVTGQSMGGYGTWALAMYIPKRFAALVPICGGGDPNRTKQLADIPIWAFHGAKDKAVPIREAEDMVEALKKHGGNVKFTVYPEAGHDAWTETYANPELYKWLLERKRTPKNEPQAQKEIR